MPGGGRCLSLIMVLLLLVGAAAEAAREITFLTVAYSGELIKYLQDEVVPQFKGMHDAEVALLTADWNTRMERTIVLTAGGRPPDVVVTGFYSPYEEGSLGLLEPLDRYLVRWPYTSRFSKGLWEAMSWQGHVYVVPQNLDFRGIGYNKQVFAESGFDPEKPPASWDELTQYALRLTRVEGDRVAVRGFAVVGAGAAQTHQLSWFMRQAGLPAVDIDRFTSNLLSSQALEALETLLALYEAGQGAMPVMSGDILQGRIAMRSLAPHSIRSMVARDPDFVHRLGLFAPRRTPSSTPVAHVFANGLAIPSASKNKDLAWEWITMLTSDDVLFEIQRIGWFFSGRLDMLHRMMGVQPGIEMWYAMEPYLQRSVITPPRDIAQTELNELILKTYDRQISPRAALENAHALWSRLLKDWETEISRSKESH